MTRRLELLRQLRTPSDVFLVLRIFAFAALIPIFLRVKLAKLAVLLEPRTALPPPNLATVQRIGRLVDLVLRVGSPLLRPTCLTRGLTLYYFLTRAGLDVSMCFGMGKCGEEFIGHCWLVKDGEPFLEAHDPRLLFTEIYRVPAQNSSPGFYDQLQRSVHQHS
jgi:hypothetical protein